MVAAPYPRSLERFPTLRQSRLSTFDKCALQANFEEEYRRDWSGHPQARGQILHRVFARAMGVMHEQHESRVETDVILELLYDTLRQSDVDQECPVCGKEIIDRHDGRVTCAGGHAYRSDLVNIPFREIKDLRWEAVKFANDNEFDIENLVDIEHRLSATLTYPGLDGHRVSRTLTGQLDVLFVAGDEDEEAIVIDYKSTWDIPAPSEVGFEGYFQQRFYAWLVMKCYPAIMRVTTREHYTRFSAFREATVHRGELDDLELEFAALAERFDRAFEQENFPPSPGRHCQLCPRPGACPIFPGVRQEGQITDDEMAKKVAGEALVAKAAYDMRMKALRAWASVRGPIPITSTPGRERVWGFREGKRTRKPTKEELERQLYLHGSNIDLNALYKEETVARFTPHHPVEIEDSAEDAKLMNALEQSLAQGGDDASQAA
jgi:hypothetical protein